MLIDNVNTMSHLYNNFLYHVIIISFLSQYAKNLQRVISVHFFPSDPFGTVIHSQHAYATAPREY